MINTSKLYFLFILFLTFILQACVAKRLSPANELQAAQATAHWLEEKYGFIHTLELQSLIDRITTRLSSSVSGSALGMHSGTFNKLYSPQVIVLNADEPNAFSVGAGLIFITRGLILETRTEAELAAVIAHELAHELLGHTSDALYSISKSRSTSSSPNYSFTLEHELAADDLSVEILRVSRYDIREATSALTIAYRPFERVVSKDHNNWLALRLAYLHEKIARANNHLPATLNSREFTRVRKTL
jgi:hypothetical protein